MLLLTRRAGESLIIGDDITITIISINGNQIRIGIEAPKGIPINRSELWERIKEAEKNNHPNDKKEE